MKLAIMMTGGIDSTTLLYQAMKLKEHAGVDEVVLLYVNYGQAAAHTERGNVMHHAALTGCEVATLRYEYACGAEELSTRNFNPPLVHDPDDPDYYEGEEMLYPDTHVEGRNAIMVTNCLAWCAQNKVDELWAGYTFSAYDWSCRRKYKLATCDNGPDFVDAMNLVSKYGFSYQTRFRAPFMDSRWTKSDVVELAEELEVDLSHTYSCYHETPCGKCDNCFLREKTLKEDI